MELVTLLQSVAGGNNNPRKAFKEFGAEKLETLSKPFMELSEETVIALILNWMDNKGKNGEKFKLKIHTEESTYTSVARIYATRMTVTHPVREDHLRGKTLYLWKPTDCYNNLTALSIKQSVRRAKRLNWEIEDNYENSIVELLKSE